VHVEDGVHLENLQELLCARLIFAECLCALMCLRPGGAFVCKLFDTTSDLTATTVYLMLAAFDGARVVKPPRSRAANSERYLCCTGFRGRGAARAVVALMARLHARGFVGAPGADPVRGIATPRAAYPLAELRGALGAGGRLGGDAAFAASFGAAATALMMRQIAALGASVDATLRELAPRSEEAAPRPRRGGLAAGPREGPRRSVRFKTAR